MQIPTSNCSLDRYCHQYPSTPSNLGMNIKLLRSKSEAYGTRNLRTELYLFLLSCFVVVGAAKTYGRWKNNQNYFAFLLYFNSLSCFWWK